MIAGRRRRRWFGGIEPCSRPAALPPARQAVVRTHGVIHRRPPPASTPPHLVTATSASGLGVDQARSWLLQPASPEEHGVGLTAPCAAAPMDGGSASTAACSRCPSSKASKASPRRRTISRSLPSRAGDPSPSRRSTRRCPLRSGSGRSSSGRGGCPWTASARPPPRTSSRRTGRDGGGTRSGQGDALILRRVTENGRSRGITWYVWNGHIQPYEDHAEH
jgi:hypothetical protein